MATLKKMPEGEQIESNELFMALVDKVIVGEGLTFVIESNELFMALVDKVIVGEGLTFVLRDGSTRGVRF